MVSIVLNEKIINETNPMATPVVISATTKVYYCDNMKLAKEYLEKRYNEEVKKNLKYDDGSNLLYYIIGDNMESVIKHRYTEGGFTYKQTMKIIKPVKIVEGSKGPHLQY